MAIVAIKMFDDPSFTQEVTLSDVEYSLHFDWNVRGAFWSMTISDRAGNVIISNKRLVSDWPILSQHQSNANLPAGDFIVHDSNPNTAALEPGRHDFVSGRNLQLLFIEAGT